MQTISSARPARTPLRRSLLAVVAIGMLAVAGCGGSDDKSSSADDAAAAAKKKAAAFTSGAKAATTETTNIGNDIGTAIQGASKATDAELAATFTSLATRARAVVADLNALETPQASRAEVTALVGALGTGAQDLDAIATAARASNADSARSATETLVRDSPAIKAAKEALETEIGAGGTSTTDAAASDTTTQ